MPSATLWYLHSFDRMFEIIKLIRLNSNIKTFIEKNNFVTLFLDNTRIRICKYFNLKLRFTTVVDVILFYHAIDIFTLNSR